MHLCQAFHSLARRARARRRQWRSRRLARFGEQPRGEAACQRGGGQTAVIGGHERRAHRLHLLLHQLVELLQRAIVERAAQESVASRKQERPRIGAGQSHAQVGDLFAIGGERNGDAGASGKSIAPRTRAFSYPERSD